MKNHVYSERLIAFIDVLGFRALIDKTAAGNQEAESIVSAIANAITGSLDDINEVDAQGDFVLTQFSDSFVISCPLSDTDKHRVNRSLGFVARLLEIQKNFLASGVLLRGGITHGSLIHDNRLLFGPAMVRAYDLESKIARVPRIILDPASVPLIDEHFLKFSFAQDDDGYWFLDIFEQPLVHYLVPSRLLQLQQAIEGIPRTVELEEKRIWMSRKFNAVLNDFSPSDFEKWLRNKVDDIDCNPAVREDFEILLAPSKQLRKFDVG